MTTPPGQGAGPYGHLPAGRSARRALALTGALLAVAGTAGCGGDVTPSQDDYAGRPQGGGSQAASSQGGAGSQGQSPSSDVTPTAGPYADGSYTASEDYGPVDDVVKEDSLDVTITLSEGRITEVDVVGHALTSTSQEHIQAFVDAIDEAVVGRSIEDAHVQALAGASKTSAAFNDAVDAVAEQARQAAATSEGS